MEINRIRLISLIITILIVGGLTWLAGMIPPDQRPGPLHAIKKQLKIQRASVELNQSEIKVVVQRNPNQTSPTESIQAKEH